MGQSRRNRGSVMANKKDVFFSLLTMLKGAEQVWHERLKRWPQVLYGTVGLLTFLFAILLLLEYRFFCAQSERVLQMKEEYRTYLVAVKKVMGDYAKAKERIDELELMIEKKKKNSSDMPDVNVEQTVFSEDASVYSTDDEEEPEFVLINREPAYLKRGAVAFYKRQKLSHMIAQLDDDAWVNYTDHLQRKTVEEKKHALCNKTRRMRVRRAIAPSSIAKITAYAAERHLMRDIVLDWPLSHFWLSSRFGARKNPNGLYGFHYGVDLAAPKGTPVRSAAAGVVIQAQRMSGFGNVIVIAHNRKYCTRYAHLDEILVRVGRQINRGDLIGKVGDSGRVRGKKDASHLHFEVMAFGKRLNPLFFLS
jgi:murein DD-endopeptidase MepM/ murein hydrolase activator NlpD